MNYLTVLLQFLRPGSCFGIQGSLNLTRQCSSLTPRPPSSEGALEEDEDRPHMLHVVWRTRSLKRRPYWERKIIQQLMLQRVNYLSVLTPLVFNFPIIGPLAMWPSVVKSAYISGCNITFMTLFM